MKSSVKKTLFVLLVFFSLGNLQAENSYWDEIKKHWENGKQGCFKSSAKLTNAKDLKGKNKPLETILSDKKLKSAKLKNDIFLRYKTFIVKNEKGAVVICSGRTEYMAKYQEIIYQLNKKNYSVYIYDHRGQGYSDRILKGEENHDKGYVESFDYYVLDLQQFIDGIVKSKPHKKLFLIAHSMGGAIASLYLEKTCKNPVFDAAILCSPMHQISTDFIKYRLLRGVGEKILSGLLAKFGKIKYIMQNGDKYVKNQDHKIKPLGKDCKNCKKALNNSWKIIKCNDKYCYCIYCNGYTSDKERYNRFFVTLMKENKDCNIMVFNCCSLLEQPKCCNLCKKQTKKINVKLGGPTWRWFYLAVNASKKSIENAKDINIPVLVLQGQHDAIVVNDGHQRFCRKLNKGKQNKLCLVITVPGAYHEILIEKDPIRNKALGYIEKFMDNPKKFISTNGKKNEHLSKTK